MKFLISILITNMMTIYAQQSNQYLKETESIITGLLQINNPHHFNQYFEITSCLSNSKNIFLNFKKAVRKLDSKSFVSVKESIDLIRTSLKLIFKDIKLCKTNQNKFQNLLALLKHNLKWIKKITSLIYVKEKSLIINNKEIYQNLSNYFIVLDMAMISFQKEQFQDFGNQLGLILFENHFQGQELKSIIIAIKDILLGMLIGINYQFQLDCLTLETDDSFQNFKLGAQQIEELELSTIIDGIENFAIGIQKIIKYLFKTCNQKKQIETALKEIMQRLKSFRNQLNSPSQFIYHVGKNLILNGVDIYDEVMQSGQDIQNGNWFDFGFQIGEILEQIFIGYSYELKYWSVNLLLLLYF